MSVPKYKRNENKLQAYVDTINVVRYTINMCENPKIFPKKCRWTICNKLLDNCLDAVVKIRRANKIVAKTSDQAKERLRLEKEVLQHFDALWGLMDIAYNAYNIPTHTIEVWSGLMLTADDRVSGWRKYDVERFRKEFKTKNSK